MKLWKIGLLPVILWSMTIGAHCVGARRVDVFPRVAARPKVTAVEPDHANCAELLNRAASEPVALLREAVGRLDAAVRDYEGTFVYQQVCEGNLSKPSICRFKFRCEPFSLLLEWTEGAGRVDRLLYVDGQNDGNMIVRPTGWIGRIIRAASIDPLGKRALKGGARPITQFGLRQALLRILDRYQTAQEANTLRSECLGLLALDGAPVIQLRKVSDEDILLIDLDVASLLPVRIRKLDPAGNLLLFCRYVNLKFNNGFDGRTFSREANDL
jgi:hypothetical protein